VSFTSFVRLTGGVYDSIEDVPLKRFLVKLKPGATNTDTDNVVKLLRDMLVAQSDLQIFDYRDAVKPITQANQIMNYFFNFTTIVAMLICFFSLMSSMYTNIYEQTKEIGILRAMGLSKSPLVRIYIYEAFVLVFSSCILGIIIGTIVAYTMTLQRILFTQLPVPFIFPYLLLATVFGASVLCSVISAVGPIYTIIQQNIVVIMRILT